MPNWGGHFTIVLTFQGAATQRVTKLGCVTVLSPGLSALYNQTKVNQHPPRNAFVFKIVRVERPAELRESEVAEYMRKFSVYLTVNLYLVKANKVRRKALQFDDPFGGQTPLL